MVAHQGPAPCTRSLHFSSAERRAYTPSYRKARWAPVLPPDLILIMMLAALDTPALPLLLTNLLQHLQDPSPRIIREIMMMDGGLDRLPQCTRSFNVSRRRDDTFDAGFVASGSGTSSTYSDANYPARRFCPVIGRRCLRCQHRH